MSAEKKFEKIRPILRKVEKTGYNPSEKRFTQVDIVRDTDKVLLLHVLIKDCVSEANGRPETQVEDYLYPLTVPYDTITEDNWKEQIDNKNRIMLQHECYIGCFNEE